MKHISIESVTPNLNSSFLCAVLENGYFTRPLHIHPEYELILLEKGGGMIFVGDMTAPLQEGMFMLLGPSLPHFWLSSAEYYQPENKLISRCSYCQFMPDIFPKDWEHMPEFYLIHKLLLQSERGVLFNGKKKEDITKRFRDLRGQDSFQRLTGLYCILQELALLEGNQCMSSIAYKASTQYSIDPIVQKVELYLNANYNTDICLTQIADAANMNPTALCRHYKKQTGKTIFERLTELRISYASKLLLNKTAIISNVAYDCGYTSRSHFNEQFKKLMGQTPREYVRQLNKKQD